MTEILSVVEKRFLESWRARVGHREADKKKDEAQVLGTKVHTAAHLVALDLAVPHDSEIEAFVEAVKRFHADYVEEVLVAEKRLVSSDLMCGGTVDLVCRLKSGGVATVDFKTSASLQEQHNWQTAGYALLLREHGYRINHRAVVRIKKDKPGEFYVRWCKEHEADARGFLACRDLWWSLNRRKMAKFRESSNGS